MDENFNLIRWQLLDDADAVAHEACERILRLSKQVIDKNGFFKIVLAGGGYS
jgi:6-phosphogluconolactonase/glucosamine-6-phosphate isomerase/deaminase